MKIVKIEIKNVGIIEHELIPFNFPLILFFGSIRQGKSTILNAVKFAFGGSFPADLIRHGQSEAFVELTLDDGSIRREWYISEDGTTKARPIVFVRKGKVIQSPTAEIKRFLNPFLLDNEYFARLGESERKAYFIDVLGIDTSVLDNESIACDKTASELRVKVKAYGDIDTTEVKAIDVVPLKAELERIKKEHADQVVGWNAELKRVNDDYQKASGEVIAANRKVIEHNSTVDRGVEKLASLDADIKKLEQQLEEAKAQRSKVSTWLDSNKKRIESPLPPQPDVSALRSKIDQQPDTRELESRISSAAANAVRVERYQENVKRFEAKQSDQAEILRLEGRKREIKVEKAKKLKGIADSCGIKSLSFDEEGSFQYEDTAAGMLSTSQIMRLSADLSALYPEGFGIGLLDRGESLGKSIFEFVERAKLEHKTILAAVVGERPAEVPAEVGVFIVSNGKVTQ